MRWEKLRKRAAGGVGGGHGSALNKADSGAAGAGDQRVAPWAVTPLLMIGGAFLISRGFESSPKFLHSKAEDAHHQQLVDALSDPKVNLVQVEKGQGVKGRSAPISSFARSSPSRWAPWQTNHLPPSSRCSPALPSS